MPDIEHSIRSTNYGVECCSQTARSKASAVASNRSVASGEREQSDTMLLASAGKPILHSRSPEIFNAAFSHLGLDARYVRLAASDANDLVQAAREMGLRAFNITSPFKESIIPLLDSVDEHARKIGAVNTVIVENGEMLGHNTDYIGVQDALAKDVGNLKGKKAVVLGAGGAARAAAYALVSAKARTTVANRTPEKAREIADSFGCAWAGLDDIGELLNDADILVSCLPIAEPVVPASSLRKGLIVMDAHYGTQTALQKDAKKKGCKMVDGREWLLYQAVPRFEYITGKAPPLDEMRKALYAKSRPQKPNIALIGFMGAGKSTVGKMLAHELGMEFLDTDSLIESRAGASVQEIFKKRGVSEFRKLEKDIAIGEISQSENKVFSCGGGIIIDEENRKAIEGSSIVVWLWVSPEVAVQRIGEGTRPLLDGAEDRLDAAKKLIAWRLGLYAQASDLVINAGNKPPQEVAERIIYEINQTFGH
ncbi:Shikimate dehydrogenase (NADP(+)) [uncultured archaeon]|nr:Shikimate dehydrogenase (NADP(+)) [uncultured archaeon]